MARRGDHSSGSRFRGGGDRQRLGGEGGVRIRGTSTMGRLAGDWDGGAGGPMAVFGQTDTPRRQGGRYAHSHAGGMFGGGGGRRYRRGRRR